jgi:two-component system, NarL family, nitrate/nitrite response regulator NarL
MRVLIVDDHEMFAESLSRLLVTREGIQGVAHVASVAAARDAAVHHMPDLAVVDWSLPDGTGRDAIRVLRDTDPAVRILVLTGAATTSVVHQALDAGADGFLTKDRAADDLFDAIETVARGEVSLTADALSEVLRSRSEPPADVTLSDRELEVLDLLAAGRSNKAIAAELYLSVHTVRNHVQRISHRLGAHSRLEAVVTAVQAGLITLPDDPA